MPGLIEAKDFIISSAVAWDYQKGVTSPKNSIMHVFLRPHNLGIHLIFGKTLLADTQIRTQNFNLLNSPLTSTPGLTADQSQTTDLNIIFVALANTDTLTI
jgi:hypothetical protein